MEFGEAYKRLWTELGVSRKMVLSSSFENIVTSRTMSIIILEERFYFQTDKMSRKYSQLKGNCNAALCIENIQIQGLCRELGHPNDNIEFRDAYKKYFPSAYNRYTSLENERLFQISPTFIERWHYMDGVPFIEKFDIANRKYVLEQYIGV